MTTNQGPTRPETLAKVFHPLSREIMPLRTLLTPNFKPKFQNTHTLGICGPTMQKKSLCVDLQAITARTRTTWPPQPSLGQRCHPATKSIWKTYRLSLTLHAKRAFREFPKTMPNLLVRESRLGYRICQLATLLVSLGAWWKGQPSKKKRKWHEGRKWEVRDLLRRKKVDLGHLVASSILFHRHHPLSGAS